MAELKLKLSVEEENKKRVLEAVRKSVAKKKKKLEELKTDLSAKRLKKAEYNELKEAIINQPVSVMERYVKPGRPMSPNKIVTSKEWLKEVAEIRTEFFGETFKPQQHLKIHQYLDALYSSQSGEDIGFMSLMYFSNTKALNPLGATRFDTVDVSLASQHAVRKKEQLYEFIHSQRTMYHTPATFNGIKRTKERVRQMHACYVDIDCYKEGIPQKEVVEAIFWFVKRGDIPMPSFIVSSGRGIYVLWLLNDIPATSKAVRYYDLIQGKLVEVFSNYGSDHKAKSVNGYLRLPGTLHPKANKKVEILFYDLDVRYEMRYLGEWFALSDLMDSKVTVLPERVQKASKKIVKFKNKKDSKVETEFSQESFQKKFQEDLLRLVVLRGYDMEGYRSHWLYMMHHSLLRRGLDESIVMDKVHRYNNRFKEPLPENEVDSLVKSSKKRHDEWVDQMRRIQNGEPGASPTKYNFAGYNWSSKRVIRDFEITVDEMAHLKLFVNEDIKLHRKKKRDKEYYEEHKEQIKEKAKASRRQKNSGLTNREATKQKNINDIKALLEQGLKQIEIATRLGLTKGYISQIVRKIKSENN